MNNILKSNTLNIEDDFMTKNQELKITLTNLLDKLPSLTTQEWSKIFELMNSNSLGGKINVKEAYVVAFSKILLRYAILLHLYYY